MSQLQRVIRSMRDEAAAAGVQIVSGDTKVVDRGKGDGLFINTAGVGTVEAGVDLRPSKIATGDRIILNGPVGLHGIAVMAAREGMEFASPVLSDCAPLNGLVERMLDVTKEIHALRDPTRGGVAGTLNEIVGGMDIGIRLY